MKALTLCLTLGLLASHSFAAAGALIGDPAAGQKLAHELRTLQPTENAEISGALKISRPNSPEKTLPLRLKVILLPAGGWKSVYQARLSNGGTESLIILHTTNQVPQYELLRGDSVDSIKETNSTATFAGSDFTLLDLGLAFLHWPNQILVTKEMRKGRGCDVLESRPARTNLYARIVSWLDQETSGLLMAEGYDARGKLLKEFEVKSFKKVAGQWQVREMEIRNRQEKTSTRLQFEFDKQ
jgi:hypothetical protein